MLRTVLFLIAITTLYSEANEPIIGGPCQGCELVFAGMPDQLQSHTRITAPKDKGEAMTLTGIVYAENGSPAPGIIIYAYHTDETGIYPKDATFHGRLRGWAKTNQHGEYRFDTIRPGSYPGRRVPEHIHLHVIEPQKGTYYIDSVEFSDDPLLTKQHIEKQPCRGGCGVTDTARNEFGHWLVRRNIFLGQAIPN